MTETRLSGVHGDINDLPSDFTRGSDLGTSAWMVPVSGKDVRLPIAMDPRTGRPNPSFGPQSHGSWLEKNRKWLLENFQLDVDPLVETGWTAIQNGWIRKTGEPNALNYTVSASDLEGNLRRVSNDIWATVAHYQSRGKDPSNFTRGRGFPSEPDIRL